MNDTTRQIVEPISREQVDTAFANVEQGMQKPQIIAGTSDGLLFLDTEQRIELEGNSITAIALSQDGLWTIANHNSVWHRNSNNQWHQVASVNDLQLNCILPLEGEVLVGTSGACLIRITDGNIHRTNCFQEVEERKEWYTPWGDPPDVRSMAVSQSGEIYVNVHVGGILRSSDGGKSWQPTIDFHADVHEVQTVLDRPELVLAATAEGLAISQDRGDTWSFDRANLHAVYSRAIAVCKDTILMTASTGPRTTKAAIYRHPLDRSGAFEKCDRGLPEWFSSNINTGTVATLENFAAFGTSDGQIFLSNDAGLTWQQTATELASINCLSLA